MNNKKLLIWIPIVALVCNGLGYVIVSKIRSTRAPVNASAELAARTGAVQSGDPAKEESGRARRAAGLAALEAGDYGKALINFTEARALLGDAARVDELLRVTEDLRSRGKSPAQPESAVAPAPTVAAAPFARFPGVARPFVARPAIAARPPAAPESAPAEARPAASTGSGLLLVTTTPRGLLVQVDGSPVDLTPMRSSVKAGSHRVALLDGDRRLYETSVDITEGSPTTILRDLSSEMVADSRSNVVAAMVKDEPSRPTASPSLPAAAELAAPQAAKPVTAIETGGLEISSPGMYGVIWVNGRPQGYPPVRMRDLPPGPVNVEVRVNGVEKRASTVVVQPGINTTVKLR